MVVLLRSVLMAGVLDEGAGRGRRTEGAVVFLGGGLKDEDRQDGALVVRAELDGDWAVLSSAGGA